MKSLIWCVFFALASAQNYYIPAQILIPTYNATHILVTNGSIPAKNNTLLNNTRPSGNNYYPPSSYNVPFNGYNSSWNNTNSTSEGHLFAGNIQTFDRLLFNQEFFKDRRWWATREKIIEYPKDVPAGYSRHETIHAIRIYNKFYDGSSARAYILRGGVGSQYVKIKLESKWNHGFRYLVQIYGH